ncbi:MAG: hypothetical protein AAGA18_12485 [Verrucomicrobiota bacterium]
MKNKLLITKSIKIIYQSNLTILLGAFALVNTAHTDSPEILSYDNFPSIGESTNTVVIYSKAKQRFLQRTPSKLREDAVCITLDERDSVIKRQDIDDYMQNDFDRFSLTDDYYFTLTAFNMTDANNGKDVYLGLVSPPGSFLETAGFGPDVDVPGREGWIYSSTSIDGTYTYSLFNFKEIMNQEKVNKKTIRTYSGYMTIQNYEIQYEEDYEGYYWATNDSIKIDRDSKLINITPFATDKNSSKRKAFKIFIVNNPAGNPVIKTKK